MSDELQNAATIASLRAELERLKVDVKNITDISEHWRNRATDAEAGKASLWQSIITACTGSGCLNAHELRQALNTARERVRDWNVLVAQGCTPGGSEFHDTPQNVARYIKERTEDKDRIIKSQQKELNKARERAGVLEREVRAWRHWNCENDKVGGDDEVDANANAAWGLLECCQRETDRTHALDAAKFGGAT